jgi:DNA-binding LytR/AlgR family response regulator
MTDRSITVLVADDEPLARRRLLRLLRAEPGIEVVAECKGGRSAVEQILARSPDLVFLDIQMPDLDGFEVIAEVGAERMPAVVFVTAYDQYALDAFKVNAVDYLLKPVDATRLDETLERVRRRVETDQRAKEAVGREELERVLRAVSEAPKSIGKQDQFAIRTGERFLLVSADEIVHASMVDDAIVVVTNTASGTSNYRTLDELSARLDPSVFWRVHRSHLVNITKIKEIVPWFSRNYILKMRDPKATEIPVSRAQTRRLREYLQL